LGRWSSTRRAQKLQPFRVAENRERGRQETAEGEYQHPLQLRMVLVLDWGTIQSVVATLQLVKHAEKKLHSQKHFVSTLERKEEVNLEI
jgi:hypothetical protein